jgi:hypothetical protein
LNSPIEFPKVSADVKTITSWDDTTRTLIVKPAEEGGLWKTGVVHWVTLNKPAFVAVEDDLSWQCCRSYSFKFTTSVELPVEQFTNSEQIQIQEFQDTMTKIEKDQLVQLEAILMAVDHALVTQKLDGNVKRPSYERPDQPGQLIELVLGELKRIEKELADAFGENFDLDRLLEAKIEEK